MTAHDPTSTLTALAQHARESSCFAGVRQEGGRLECDAKGASAPAQYRVEVASDGWRVSLGTLDRWLSESIESQLVEGRESIEDLLQEELTDLEWMTPAPTVKHFRDESKRYVFECTVSLGKDTTTDVHCARTFLFAFESMFRQLGDMSESGAH
ncbi:MAG: hypothetical protein EXS15_01090 [Phycisphaerales bacterium]|nr:hypothetical protein [Phycisphaerales bacterium]